MDESIEYSPLVWRFYAEEEAFCLVRHNRGRMCRVYGPFDREEARQAAEIWGVPLPDHVLVTE